MINYYFGLPGCGKTTHLVATAIRENQRIIDGLSRYTRVLSNVRFALPEGVESNCFYFENEDFGQFDMSDSLILFDESQMQFDNRDYAKLKPATRNFLMLHRHYHTSIYFYNQTYNSIDCKIRFITNNVYYLKRSILGGKTVARKIKYEMYVPKKPKRGDLISNDPNGEIVMRYYQSGFFDHLLSCLFVEPKIKLKKYWSYFDSFDAPEMPKKEFERL